MRFQRIKVNSCLKIYAPLTGLNLRIIMKITTAILAFLFVFTNVTTSNAAIIVTTSLIANGPNLAASLTHNYIARATITTSGGNDNSSTSFGFRLTLSGTGVPGNISAILPIAPLDPGPAGFNAEFTHASTVVGGNAVNFIGRNQGALVAFNNPPLNGTPTRFLDYSFTVNRSSAFVLTATAAAIPGGYIGDSTGYGANGSGTGFVTASAGVFVAGAIGTNVNGATFVVDPSSGSVGITAVPEPNSIAMLAVAGIFGVGVQVRRWKSKRKSAS